MLEHVEVFRRSLGTETDVVQKVWRVDRAHGHASAAGHSDCDMQEMYTIKDRDKDATDVLALRPENTAGACSAYERAVCERANPRARVHRNTASSAAPRHAQDDAPQAVPLLWPHVPVRPQANAPQLQRREG